jgi:mannosyltransferase
VSGLRRADWLILPILLLAAGIRIVTSGYALWFDEIAATAFARQPIGLLWSGWMVREANPPLYYTLLGGWGGLFGTSDIAAQMLSVAIGLVGIGAAWWLARRIGGTWAGLIAALLLAISAAHVDFSQEVRGYILAQTAALFGCVAMVAYLERPRWAPLAGYAVAALVALYAHTTMASFVALGNLAMLWLIRRDQRALVRWFAANLAVALLWSWWAWISLKQAAAGGSGFSWIDRPSLRDALDMTGAIYLPLYIASEKVAFAAVLALAWLGGMVWIAMRDRRPATLLLAILAVGAPLLLWATSQAVPIFLGRTLFWAAGPMTVLLAVALADLKSPRVRLGLIVLLLALETGALLRWLPMRETEAWPQALAAAARIDPKGVILVEGDAMGVAAQRYIEPGGMQLAILDLPAANRDHWADGLTSAPHLDAAGARALLSRRGSLFTLKRGDYDPGRTLGPVGVEQAMPGATRSRQPGLSLWRARKP